MIDFAFAAESVLLITLDSCRYDTFAETDLPSLKAVGPPLRAMAPSYFTYGSHASMFVGFTPSVADGSPIPYANAKFARIFKIDAVGFPGRAEPYFELDGRNIIEGFRRQGLLTLGTGAMGWFDPTTPASAGLIADFDQFYYHGWTWSLRSQLDWISQQLTQAKGPVFLFLNIGETHVPYYFEGAPWDASYNPCIPFAGIRNDAAECRRRQSACLRYVDTELAPLLKLFRDAAIVLCGDHGDCWGEDGLWEHGIAHEKVFEVPLILHLPERHGKT